MIDPETKRKCRELGTPGLAEAIEMVDGDRSYAELPFDERIRIVVDYAHQDMMNKKVASLIKTARLRLPEADISNIDYDGRPLSRDLVLSLGTSQFVSTATDILLQGYAGTGNYVRTQIMLGNGP